MSREHWSDERRRDYEDTMRDKAREAEEAECFDDEPPEARYDCGNDGEVDPCGTCIVCLETLLDERTRDLEAAQAKADAWDRLVEMRAELSWHVDMERWWMSVPYGIDEHGLVAHDTSCTVDPVAIVAAAHARWVDRGRPAVTRTTDERDAALRHCEDRKLEDAEEIKARRAKGAADV